MIEIQCPCCAYSFKAEDKLRIVSEDEYIIEEICPECGEYIVLLFDKDENIIIS